LPKLAHSNASLKFCCPNYATPLSFHRRKFLPSWLGIIVASAVGFAIGALEFQLAPTSFDIATGHAATLCDMAITIFTAINLGFYTC